MLQTLEAQLARYRSLITECFKQHPDHALFTSLPGAGPKLAPRLLGELVALKPLADTPQALQCLAGKMCIRDRFCARRGERRWC